jgi:ribosomal protein S18 acetylase RimI-like enzyme
MKADLLIRQYKNNDQEAVLNLLRLNTARYFSPEEESDLLYYLENEIEQYFVLEINRQIVGSGGFNFTDNQTTGIISWDIVHPDFQGRSLGSTLLKYRLERLQQMKTIQKIIVRTSQLVYLFYEKGGFQLMKIEEDYWAKGFHLYQMEYHTK